MRPFRLIAGLLTLSLILGAVLGDFFHVQERSEAQASAHSVVHTDGVGMDDDLYALDSDASSKGCFETGAQAVIALIGQQLSTVNAVGVFPVLTAEMHNCPEIARICSGRAVPLFEHASLFAATVSMRI